MGQEEIQMKVENSFHEKLREIQRDSRRLDIRREREK